MCMYVYVCVCIPQRERKRDRVRLVTFVVWWKCAQRVWLQIGERREGRVVFLIESMYVCTCIVMNECICMNERRVCMCVYILMNE